MIINAHPTAELLAKTDANVNWSHRSICATSGAAMTFQNVFAIRDSILSAQNEFDAFVITTGTDSGDEVAFLLDRLLYGHIKIGIVVTGAMKPSDIIGYDGPSNVEAAARVAVNPHSKNLGVLFVENDTIHAARYVYKSDATLIGSFRSRCGGPLGFVRGARVVFNYTGLPPLPYAVPLTISQAELSRFKVVIWTMALDAFFPEIMLHEVDGLVIAGEGTGSISNSILSMLASYTSSVRMAMSTRCVTGTNYDDWYYKGSLEKYEKLGIEVAAFEGLNPQQTRLTLMLNMATGNLSL
jgi:L-asparaginase